AGPRLAGLEKRHRLRATLQDHERIEAHELAVFVGVAIACTGLAFADAAQHRARIAADHLDGDRLRAFGSVFRIAHSRARRASDAEAPESRACGYRWH